MAALAGIVSLATLAISLALLFWHFLGYPLLMTGLGRKRRSSPPPTPWPMVSVILPVYNEERGLAPRVSNLLAQDYPPDRIEIVVVESGSTDHTLSVARDLIAAHPNVKLVDQGARLGKGSAVAAGRTVASGSIVVVSDANTTYHPATLRRLVEPFGDPKVGGVGGRFVPRNADDPGAAGSRVYWSLEELERIGEAVLDSCCTFHGEVYAWRRDLVQPDPTAILDDLDTALQIRRKGYRVGYAPEALAFESVPTRVRDMTTQWRKNALGAIQCGFRNVRFLLGAPSFYTYLIFPSHKGLQVLQPFLMAAAVIGLVGALVAGLAVPAAAVVGVLGVLSLGAGLALVTALRRGADRTRVARLRIGAFMRTFLAFQWAILLGWKDYLAGKRDVRWEKVESTRT